jgi:hypothetical protein
MILRSWAIPDEINDLQDAERVHHEERDEPPLLTVTCSMPESIALENDSPDYSDDKKWHDAE